MQIKIVCKPKHLVSFMAENAICFVSVYELHTTEKWKCVCMSFFYTRATLKSSSYLMQA